MAVPYLPMRRVETIFIVIAIAFYAWFLTHYGPHQVIGYVRMAGWGLALTIALEALSRIANTLGWRVTIEHYPPNLRFIELFAARIGGEAIDYVTPSAQLGGQFVMAVDVCMPPPHSQRLPGWVDAYDFDPTT